jgi:hypothetical protein
MRQKGEKASRKSLQATLIGMLFYYSLSGCVYYCGRELFCCLILFPYCSNIGVASIANWSWHIFTLPHSTSTLEGNKNKSNSSSSSSSDSINDYISSTITTTGVPFDIFNEGYHLTHHLKPQSHYSTMPQLLTAEVTAEYSQQRSMILEGIDVGGIWILVMLRQWRKLGECWVNAEKGWSEEEKQKYLRYRTLPKWKEKQNK